MVWRGWAVWRRGEWIRDLHVHRRWRRRALSGSAGRERRAQTVSQVRIVALTRTGVVDEGAAGLLVDQELDKAQALVREGADCGRWQERSAIGRAVAQTLASAAHCRRRRGGW